MTTNPISSRKLRTCLPNHFLRSAWLLLATFLLAGCLRAVPLPVRIDARDGMSRGGDPYFVKGAGGSENLDPLAARGANSIRTWTTNGLAEILDQSEALNLTVSAGIWLEEECAWFSYQNPEHCAKQAKRVRKEVLLYRAHPALLAWGIGNEVEGDGTNTAFWQQLDRLSRLVKSLDPAHPTFTAVAGMNQAKADGMNRYAPSLDFVGVNTYGAIFGLRRGLEKIGWKRPWLLTEWGPRGFWESPKIQSGAPFEQTSTEKAAMMRKAYQAVISPDGGCLGSYAFVWGWKFEATATWFGIMTHDGQTTAVADALQEVWGGGKPANQAPAVEALRGVPTSSLPAGGSFDASCRATDPDGDTLVWHWAVLPEQKKHHSANPKKMPSPVSCMITKKSSDSVGVTAPDKPGVYRLHVWIKDGKGHAATANAPFEVR
jgi:hypothetical protein